MAKKPAAAPTRGIHPQTKSHFSVRPIFAWYDLWIGFFWDAKKRRLYFLPLTCLIIAAPALTLLIHSFWALQ